MTRHVPSCVIVLAFVVGCNSPSGPPSSLDAGSDADVDAEGDAGSDAGIDAGLPAACGIDCCGSVPRWVADATWSYPRDTTVVDLAVGRRGEVAAAAGSSHESSSVSYVETFSPGLRDRTEAVVGARFLDVPTGVTRGPDGSVYVVGSQWLAGPKGTFEPPSVLIAGLRPDGTIRWTRAFTGLPPAGVVWTPAGEIVVAGALFESVDLGGGR